MSRSISEKYIALCNGSVVSLDDSSKILQNANVESRSNSAMSRENQLKKAVWNAIMELDRTKHSFKSQQIEKIKKNLLKALLDDAGSPV